MRNKKKAFTLVEMLVALAVSSIIIAATYASYELIQKQYKRNIDIAEMHTSGRSIMQVLEREIRMAGYEFRDANGTMTYGSIVGGLVITDSGDACCDEVTLIYDDVEDVVNAKGEVTSSSVERIKIRFWTEAYTSNKGDRFRLYKRKTILGRNNAILGSPIVGPKEVMADYIDDLQISNISTTGTLYGSGSRVNSIGIWNPTRPKYDRKVGSISTPIGFQALVFGPDGLLYSSGTRQNSIEIWDVTRPKYDKKVGSISAPIGFQALVFDIKKSGQLNVVSINLTLRAKNEYGRISKEFRKKDYFSGNFNIKKNDLFKRDTFSTTVSVRNL